MIDPRFANAGAVPLEGGYGAQESSPRRRHHRRHRHHKNKHGIVGTSPLSHDESIHKVDHIEGASVGTGYGVPYGAAGVGGFYQHQQYTIGTGENEGIPEQLVGQRSASALNNEVSHVRPSVSPVGAEAKARVGSHHRRHHGHHHHHHSHGSSGGYGHVSDDIIFIERGHQSRNNQGPPPGFEFKGMIQVQGSDKVIRRRHRSQSGGPIYVSPPRPIHHGPCPPGWQAVSVPAGGSCFPCSGGYYNGQAGGYYGGLGSYGGSGYYNAGSTYPIPASGQLIADYIVEPSSGGYISGGGGYGHLSGGGYGHVSRFGSDGDDDYFEERYSGKPTVIEVWQRRPRSPSRSRSHTYSRSRTRSPQHATAIELERLRSDILIAIERITQGLHAKIQLISTDSGSHTHHQIIDRERGSGETRVIVQPIQPVFYMPRQPDVPHIQPVQPIYPPQPPIQQPAPQAQIVYVPRNVYVPVIKPVFVPRERVVVRPQVIHVARPVLVDRPVPVTQRPIIIDRERPVPVPIRTVGTGVGKAGGARTIREEYVFRDNLPVAYGGRCPEYAGGINYGYMPTQQEHQYATTSVQELVGNYPVPGPVYNVTARNSYGYTPKVAQYNLNQGGGVYETYTDAVGTNNASIINGGLIGGAGVIEVLDSTINPNWQRTDQSALIQRFGRPAYEIVQRSQTYGGYGAGAGVTINGGGGYLGNNASYTSYPVGNISNLEGVVQEVAGPIDPCINY